MSRYTGSRNKIIKSLRLRDLPGFKNVVLPRLKRTQQLNRKKKQTAQQQLYKKRLIEKQKLKYYYGLTERQLVNYFLKAKRAEGSTADRLLISLEMRLDNIVFRLGLAPSIPAARQLVTHGHIRVNSKKIHSPSYACKTGDNIQSKLVSQVQQKTRAIRERARHLQPATDGGKIIGIARKQSLPFKINDLRVVEYYSR